MASTPEQRAYWKAQRERLKDQRKAYMKKWHEKNKEQQKDYAKEYEKTPQRKAQHAKQNKRYYEENRESVREYSKQYRENNKEDLKKKRAEYYSKNREERIAKHKEYYQKNKRKINKANLAARHANKQKMLRHNISAAVRLKLLNHGGKKYQASIDKILSFKIPDLIARLESLFRPGMTWDNYGEWHVDHIIPDASFNYTSVKDPEFTQSWALENLQPLWASENCSKGSRFSNITEA